MPPPERAISSYDAAEPLLELGHSIASVDEMGVAVDQSRRHPESFRFLGFQPLRRRILPALARGAEPCDALALDGDGAVGECAIRGAALHHGGKVGAHPNMVPGSI